MSVSTTTVVTHPDGTRIVVSYKALVPCHESSTMVEDDESQISPHHRGLWLTAPQVNLILTSLPDVGARGAFGGGCSGLERVALGFNNISYIVKTHTQPQELLVIRATKASWPAEKVECEVACIRLMSARTTLPVPTVVGWDSAAAQPHGCRWILMKKMPGRTLAKEEFLQLPLQAKVRCSCTAKAYACAVPLHIEDPRHADRPYRPFVGQRA
eukprot:SAG11_NODE_2277_length_3581_cov_3.122918_1_plen_213_part_00